eukprot:TRINITY_DN2758_c0_g1_i1.p1 TRINITY_DN2758_c0_g1~~TRINITY_DN2758_c0_g1_i1.p1  ORF type:complete len:829 (-),score=129.87 TRINITY_DN2758_c0_g1_i1:69-2555(-)
MRRHRLLRFVCFFVFFLSRSDAARPADDEDRLDDPEQAPNSAPVADDIQEAPNNAPVVDGTAVTNGNDEAPNNAPVTDDTQEAPNNAPVADDTAVTNSNDEAPSNAPVADDTAVTLSNEETRSNAAGASTAPEEQASEKNVNALPAPAAVPSASQAEVDEGSQDEAEEEVPDGYEDAYTHLHVAPSTHRRVQDDKTGVTLSVAFALHPMAHTLRLTLPVGYELLKHTKKTSAKDCPQVFSPENESEMFVYASMTESKEFVPNILSCKVLRGSADRDEEGQGDSEEGNATKKDDSEEAATKTHDEGDEVSQRVQIEMKLAPDTPKISQKVKKFVDSEWEEEKDMQWWFFHVLVRYPEMDPSPEDNTFLLHWSSDTNEEWEGETEYRAWPILGDWKCRYSEWDGWGSCTARCGGGTRLLTRRVLSQPPSGKACTDTVHKEPEKYPCNQHPCIETCSMGDWAPWTGCTASCGGGVRFRRKKFVGSKCPASDDIFAEVVEECNTQPCTIKCLRSDNWLAVTECDSLCGFGTFLAVRQVLQKDATDKMCMPTYERVPCMRQICTKFTVTRPDANDLPYPGEKFSVALTWEQSSHARLISIRAPFGYSFGNHGEPCEFVKGTDSPIHSLIPHLNECTVDHEESVIKLTMDADNPLPPSDTGFTDDEVGADRARYEVHVMVTNPHCTLDEWDADPIRSTRTCIPHSATKSALVPDEDSNRWTIEIFQTGNNVGTEQASAQGYRLYWKPGLKDPAPDLERPKLRLVQEADLPPALPENRKEERPKPKPKKVEEDDYKGLPVRELCRADWDCEDAAPKVGLSCDWDGMCRRNEKSME